MVHAQRIDYLNCGDWLEHRTALAEHVDDRMELIDWPTRVAKDFSPENCALPRAA